MSETIDALNTGPTFEQDIKIVYKPTPFDNFMTKHLTWDNFNKYAMMGLGVFGILGYLVLDLAMNGPAHALQLMNVETVAANCAWDAASCNDADGPVQAQVDKLALVMRLESISTALLVVGAALFAGGWSRKA